MLLMAFGRATISGMTRFPTRSRVLVVAVAVLVVAAGLAGCRVARAGTRCRTTELGQDSTYVLACRSGVWRRVITKRAAAIAIAKAIEAKKAQEAGAPTAVQGATTIAQPPPGTPGSQTPSGATILAVDTGQEFACQLLSTGSVECWGRNLDGQLGDGTTADRPTPAPVAGIVGATAIAVGTSHACAVVAGGAVSCWGNGFWGQLGSGTANRPTPIAVAGVTGAVGLAAGFAHTCAVLGTGGVRCWGSNSDGQTGAGTITGALGVAAGDDHSCALIAGGTVRCWGNNAYGQLGDGSTTNRSAPVLMAGIADATGVTASGYRTCVARASGATTCVGQ